MKLFIELFDLFNSYLMVIFCTASHRCNACVHCVQSTNHTYAIHKSIQLKICTFYITVLLMLSPRAYTCLQNVHYSLADCMIYPLWTCWNFFLWFSMYSPTSWNDKQIWSVLHFIYYYLWFTTYLNFKWKKKNLDLRWEILIVNRIHASSWNNIVELIFC